MKRQLHRQLRYGLLGITLLYQLPAHSQETASVKNRLERPSSARQRPLRDVLTELERRYKVFFSYESKLVRNIQVSAELPSASSLDATLQQLLNPVNLRSQRMADRYYSIVVDNSRPTGLLPSRLTDGPLLSLRSPSSGNVPERDLSSLTFSADKAVQPVTGTITDENGGPLVGVSVIERGTSNGTTTNADGRFTLSVAGPQSVLVFSFIGYVTQQQEVGNRSSFDLKLTPDTKSLGEVVVVAYGTQRRSSVTGAVDQVGQQALEGRPVTTVSQALQGVSPNLVVQQGSGEPGAGLNINIRGVSTLGNNSPLVIVDGIPGSLDVLNPSDIESISVLKDAGSAAIYGSRSANGVILVTTKKGAKSGKTTVIYNGTFGAQTPTLLRESNEAWEYAMFKNEALVNSGLSPQFTPSQIAQFRQQGSYPWFLTEILKKQAPQQNHNLSVSGGNAQTTYHISVGYLNQSNLLKGPDFGLNRYNYRMNLTHQIDKVKFTGILAYSRNEIKEHAYSTDGLILDAARMPRTYPIKDSLGRYVLSPILSESNPLARLEQGGYRRYDNDNVFGNLTAEWEVFSGFRLRGIFGGELNGNHQYEFHRAINYFPYTGGTDNVATVKDENYKSLYTNVQALADYTRTFGKSNVSALVGFSNEGFTSQGNGIFKRDVDNDLGTDISRTIIQNASYTSNQRTSQNAISSVFGRVNYTFADKYIAEVNFRYDGSSRFAKANRWGFFPSAALAWRITEEAFASNFRNTFGDWKLRTSYGVLGNQNVGDFQYQSTYFNFANAYGFNNTSAAGTGLTLANPDITWERAQTFNLGLDASVWRNKVTFSLDYFNKLTKDILIAPSVPGIFGGSIGDYNAAQVRNQGWEVSATVRHNTGQVRHTLSLNLADSYNKVVSIDGKTNINYLGELAVILREGLPVRSYYGYQSNGYFQNLEQLSAGPRPTFVAPGDLRPGDVRYVDQNGDNLIDEADRVVLGNPFPRYTFGATYTASWKGFDLNLFVQGVGKRSLFLRGEAVEPFHGPFQDAIFKHQSDYWTPTNPDAAYPRLTLGGASRNNWGVGSDRFLQDASYVRLKNLQVGYTLPGRLTNKLGISKLRVYYTGQNMLTLTPMQVGIDPEATEFNNSLVSTRGNVNSGRVYPNPQFNGIGLDVTF
ncbi:SusC/RagA family TonB-linked outer membrane protein [Fibrella arboris]|uniref:SusC/RagA family TonB-linked outer membrane protein n=1 Tax=Fibrella arboris TaxID=3242486 RepID=UPI003521C25C